MKGSSLVVVAAHETKLQETVEELGVTLWLCRAALSLMIHRSVQVQINAHLRQNKRWRPVPASVSRTDTERNTQTHSGGLNAVFLF